MHRNQMFVSSWLIKLVIWLAPPICAYLDFAPYFYWSVGVALLVIALHKSEPRPSLPIEELRKIHINNCRGTIWARRHPLYPYHD